MKYIIIAALLCATPYALSSTHTPLAEVADATDTFEVRVDGLGCPYCAFGLEKRMKTLKHLRKMKIDIEAGIMTFEYPAKHELSIDTVVRLVEKAGYTPVTANVARADGAEQKWAAKTD